MGILRKRGSAEVPTGILRKSSAEDFRRLPLGCHLATVARYSTPGYDVTSYLRSAFIEVRKMAENAASNSFGLNISGVAIMSLTGSQWWFLTCSFPESRGLWRTVLARVLESLKFVDVRYRNTMEKWISIIQSRLDHGCGKRTADIFRKCLFNVS